MTQSIPGHSDFRYSLIIATLCDDGDLARCLASLVGQNRAPGFEVIVVDQNADGRLLGLIEEFSDRLEIVHLRVDFRNASRARNLGVSLARGDWLGFPDDDCELLPDTLRVVEQRSRDPQVKVITGRTVDPSGSPNVLRWQDEPVEFSRWSMFGCMTEATLFVRREVFFAAGGFDERFGPGARYPAAEGIDLMNRMFAVLGDGKACYDPAVTMRHPSKIPPWNRWSVSRFHDYARGDGALIAKHPRPHMLYWGLRTLVAATLQILRCQGWRSLAFAARIAGLVRGFGSFCLTSWRG